MRKVPERSPKGPPKGPRSTRAGNMGLGVTKLPAITAPAELRLQDFGCFRAVLSKDAVKELAKVSLIGRRARDSQASSACSPGTRATQLVLSSMCTPLCQRQIPCHGIGWQDADRPTRCECSSPPHRSRIIANTGFPSPWLAHEKYGRHILKASIRSITP